ncbi:gephyrin-like molybdotransferase Glp [Acidipila rosea]|uniref:Molybdopterin molybdenumtransferase n=1 Tax=Acidipila rosea TaxID=768535 RepID=A0A4R1L5S3_9BACT|nr:gephyrin-like molybdotransferase Glp [Acidipila rosea]TCK71619.1 molybdopterin molybdochelatase [Acidipila rosea]
MNAPVKVLSYVQAAEAIGAHAAGRPRPGTEKVGLLDAQGRVLAAGVVADRDQPPFDRSTRDGFACRAEDAGGALRVMGTVRAGEVWHVDPLGAGEAVEIMTGAPVPAGADCVVMVEHVVECGAGIELQVGRMARRGENIVPRGAEAAKGGVILAAGVRMTATQIAAAAACGYAEVEVFQRPRVAVLATGDELVQVADAPLPHQIRNSNSYSLAAMVAAAGAEAVVLPVARDERGSLETSIREALECDLVLMSGGVSMGKYDLVEEVLTGLGAEFFFTGVEIQPGRPAVFGRAMGKYFFGLPGNPVSTMVTFLLFAEPMIRGTAGESETSPRFAQATLAEPVKVKTGLRRFLPAVLESAVEGSRVKLVAWQGSGDLAATARANCFAVVPPEREALAAGEVVSVLLA